MRHDTGPLCTCQVSFFPAVQCKGARTNVRKAARRSSLQLSTTEVLTDRLPWGWEAYDGLRNTSMSIRHPSGWGGAKPLPGQRRGETPLAGGGATSLSLTPRPAAVPNTPGQRRCQTPSSRPAVPYTPRPAAVPNTSRAGDGAKKCVLGLCSQETTAAGQCSQTSSALVSSPREASEQSHKVARFFELKKRRWCQRVFHNPLHCLRQDNVADPS